MKVVLRDLIEPLLLGLAAESRDFYAKRKPGHSPSNTAELREHRAKAAAPPASTRPPALEELVDEYGRSVLVRVHQPRGRPAADNDLDNIRLADNGSRPSGDHRPWFRSARVRRDRERSDQTDRGVTHRRLLRAHRSSTRAGDSLVSETLPCGHDLASRGPLLKGTGRRPTLRLPPTYRSRAVDRMTAARRSATSSQLTPRVQAAAWTGCTDYSIGCLVAQVAHSASASLMRIAASTAIRSALVCELVPKSPRSFASATAR